MGFASAGGAVPWKPGMVELSDENIEKLCDAVSQMIVDEIDTTETWNRIQKKVSDFLKEKCNCGGMPKTSVNYEAANILSQMEWSVRVKMKKKAGACEYTAPHV